jgi:hypothetical protein
MPDPRPPTLDYRSGDAPRPKWARLRLVIPFAEWLGLVAGIICSALMLWAARLPVSNLLMEALGFLIGIVSGFLCLWSAIAEIFALKPVGKPATRKAVVLVSTCLLLALTWALLYADVPRQVMFSANKPAMDRWVQKFLATPGPVPFGARVGSYDAFKIELIPGGVEFLVEGSGFFRGGGGFAYSPPGPPAATGPAWETFTPLGGGWYLRTYDEP